MLPGNRWMGIVMLFSSANGELLAIMNDGVLQRFRVGGANGVSTKYLARQNAETVGLIGSGWQAGTQVMAVCEGRRIKKTQSFQSDETNREKFAKETSEQVAVEIVPVNPIRKPLPVWTSLSRRRTRATAVSGQNGLSPKGFISALCSATSSTTKHYCTCKPLVLHTHATENNVPSSAPLTSSGKISSYAIHPTDRAIELEVVTDIAGSIGGAESKGPRIRTARLRLRQQHRHGSAVRGGVGKKVYDAAKAKGAGRESAARLVHAGRASVKKTFHPSNASGRTLLVVKVMENFPFY